MAGTADNYVFSQFEVTIDIDGLVFKDEVVSVSSTFALNDIPTASAVIACGVNMRTNQPSKIHSALNTLKPRTKTTITLTITTPSGRLDKSPPKTHVIFEGYYIGIGVQRSHANANYILHFVHWLDDLNCGSILSGNFYPGMTADLAQNALYRTVSQAPNSGVTTDGSTVALIDPELRLISVPNLTIDAWGRVFKPIFKALANDHHPMTQGGCLPRDNNSKVLIPALDKMPNGGPTSVPLSMDLVSAFPDLLSMNISTGVSKMMTNGIAYNSIWSKLVGELAASFLFAVSPGVTFANVIPFFGGLKINADATAWRTIRLNDYNYANFNSSQRQLLESINVYYPFTSNSNIEGSRDKQAPVLSFCPPCAQYPPKGQQNRAGTIMVRELPTWLYNMTSPSGYAHNGLAPEVDTHDPGKGSPMPTGRVKVRPPQTIAQHASIGEKYCEHWYKTEILTQRYGELSGKLRFDLAPGSMVAIEVPPEPPPVNPLSGGKTPSHMYASVSKVSYHINAEQHQAGTSLVLSNLRTEAENNDDLLTKTRPPLYKQPWYGGPLTIEANNDNTGP
jgi:hypothetical protein